MPIIFVPQPSKKLWIPLLFLHIPKCGGSSVEQSFLKAGCRIKLHDRIDNLEYEFLENVLIYKCPSQHFHYEILDNIVDFNIFKDVFALVRNPYARLASEYRFLSGRIGSKPIKYPIDQWVDLVFKEYSKNPFILCNHIRPQVKFMVPGKTRIFKLENGMELMLRNLLRRLAVKEGLLRDDLPSNKMSIFHEKLTREEVGNGRTKEEVLLRNSDYLSRKIQEFYLDDFKAFYPEDL